MASIQQLPSGQWRAQVRSAGIKKGKTFPTKREAKGWAATIETQARSVAISGFAPVPAGSTLAGLIDKYVETTKAGGRTKGTALVRLKRELGSTLLSKLSAITLRDFVERRLKEAGGSTVAGDLSFLSQVLKWGRYGRLWDLPATLATDARAGLAHSGIATRGKKRRREPTPDELRRLYAHWDASARQTIPMPMLCRFALASGWRQDEICRLQVDDVDRGARTAVIRDRKDPRVKEGNDETVPLLPAAWAMVEPRLDGRAGERVFPYRTASVSTAFTRACQDLGIEDLHFHDLRHAAIASFFRMGLGIPQVSVMSGHKTWSQLADYTDVKAVDVLEAVARHAVEAENVVRIARKEKRAARST
jgi:integrase